ncbi:MAG: DUF1772 domain-containing protein [Verrucomicrobiales bacterium]|nr:DUF1772 domain-containing protein [Verrucomicrobiales bacterium]
MSGSDERISGESRSIVVLPAALVSSAAMAGVIAAVQLIIYPSFLDIPGDPFAVYHQWYSQRITWIVGPLMVVELGTALLSLVVFPAGRWRWLGGIGFGIVIALWAVTGLVQVPQHSQLAGGYDAEVIEALVRGNWIRFWLWQGKLAISIVLLVAWIKSRR